MWIGINGNIIIEVKAKGELFKEIIEELEK